MKKLRLLLITLCVSVLMGSMAVTAYAGVPPLKQCKMVSQLDTL